MTRRTSLSLLAVVLVAFAATGIGATTPSEPAIEPAEAPVAAAEPALEPGTEPAAEPGCAGGAELEELTMAELAPSAAEAVEALVETGWYYGICYPNFCQQCTSDYDCTDGNICVFDVQCP